MRLPVLLTLPCKSTINGKSQCLVKNMPLMSLKWRKKSEKLNIAQNISRSSHDITWGRRWDLTRAHVLQVAK